MRDDAAPRPARDAATGAARERTIRLIGRAQLKSVNLHNDELNEAKRLDWSAELG
ncbi:MAG: hypothetical protein KGJ66_12215 [Alphaproteobacteria bacterium]|nr:hypothetical protein [Alphaproteobacteria bacterium]